MRLPQLDQEAIKFQPHLMGFVSSDFRGKVVGHMDRYLSKISMFRCHGLEHLGDPFDAHRFGTKTHICEFRRFREVD